MTLQKNTFIQSLFKSLKNEAYVLLKWLGEDLAYLPEGSDLDILVGPEVAEKIATFIGNFPNIVKSVKKDRAGVTHFYVYFEKGDFLQIDVLFQLVRKQWTYLDTQEVLDNCIDINGIKACPPSLVFKHALLFNYLNNSGLPKKYFQYFSTWTLPQQTQLIQEFNLQYGTNFQDLFATTTFAKIERQSIVRFLSSQSNNKYSQKLRNGLRYLLAVGKQLVGKRGKIITFSGVDGAGKSTIIQDVLYLLGSKYRERVVVLRHRPSLLPILSAWKYGKKKAEQKSMERLPRQGKNNSTIASLFRFSYYFLDYFFGQFYIWYKYLLRGYTVLYDRYYFDFIIDGKRSNINLPAAIPKKLYPFIAKPQLNFFLYADACTILKRKQELSPVAITSLTNQYQTLFQELGDRHEGDYVPIENLDRQNTVQTIINHYLKIA